MSALASLLFAAWQTTAVVELMPPSPGVCAIRYEDSAAGLVVTIEKRSTERGFVTAFIVSGKGVIGARLVTANVDSAKLLKPVTAQAGEAVRAEALLDDSDAGALLIHDLSNRGGRVEIKRAQGTKRYELPQTLDRRAVVSRYLFCTRDLLLPKVDEDPER